MLPVSYDMIHTRLQGRVSNLIARCTGGFVFVQGSDDREA